MRPEYYADLYRRFATYVKHTAGSGAKLVACGSHPGNAEWDSRFLEAMRGAQHLVDYLALHIYSAGGTSVLEFSDGEYLSLVVDAIALMDEHIGRAVGLVRAWSTPNHPIGVVLDEWGTWYREAVVENGLYQQNTMRDALFTAASFHCFHEHGDRLYMTNMAQTVNVLQALVLTQGPDLVVTPTCHVYEMYMPHRDGLLLPARVAGSPRIAAPSGAARDALSLSATRNEAGDELFLSVVNLDPVQAVAATLALSGAGAWRIAELRRLRGDSLRAHNTFERPDAVWPDAPTLTDTDANGVMEYPAQSITTLRLAREA